MGDTCILPLSYLPPVHFYQIMLKYQHVIFDIHEHFHKQYYFNRCAIYGANGMLKLSMPVKRNHDKTPLKEVAISYDSNWRIIHWRSLQAAYRRSPFFEFYESELQAIYMDYKPEKLIEWNLKLFGIVNSLLDIEINFSFTESYQKVYEGAADYRLLNLPKTTPASNVKEIMYLQVFQEKYGFIPKLSIIDLLFCEGRRAKELLLG